MQESTQIRIDFVLKLLLNLKDVYSQLKQSSYLIEKCSGSYYEKIFNENKDKIQNEVDKYKMNIEKVKQLNLDLTAKINVWYGFVKDNDEIKKTLFPVNFYIKKMGLKNSIKKMNESISGITIENRFIRESLTHWEHELELEVVRQIKQGSEFSDYEQLINKKDELISQLKYLLPTLPDMCPTEFELDGIDNFVERLLKIPAA